MCNGLHTNRWDPRLNCPGSMRVVLRLRLYLNEYLSDLHVFFVSESKLNIILKSDIKKERKNLIFYILFFHPKFPESSRIASGI